MGSRRETGGNRKAMTAQAQSRPLRVAVAGFHIESVSFLQSEATLADFELVALRGGAIIEALRGTNTVMGGFIDVLEAQQVDILPIVHAALGAVGPASDEAVEHYSREIAEAIHKEKGSLDGVLLFLHGACWAPSYPDPERHFLAEARAALGSTKPLMVAFDYHGNLDADTLECVDACFAYRKSPHTDTGETGRRAATCLMRTFAGEIKPVWAIAKPGVLVPSIFSATSLRPLADIIEHAETMQNQSPQLIDITVMAGFSYADAHNTGFSVICVADGSKQAAQAAVDALSDEIWQARDALYRPMPVYTVDEALDHVTQRLESRGPASETGAKPYVLLEHADRMNDSTYVLAAILERGITRAAVPFLWDPEAARKASEAGAGQPVELDLGGHSSPQAGPRLRVNAKVLWSGEKEFKMTGNYMRGMPVNLGLSALLDVNGVSVSVVTYPAFGVSGDPFYIFDQKPEDFDVIVLRSKTHFRDFYEPISEEILIVDTPDHGPADLRQLNYVRLNTETVYPFTQQTASPA